MEKRLKWQAISQGERNAVIEEIKEVVATCGGGIVDFNMFSDLALNLVIDIPRNKVPDLYYGLQDVLRIEAVELKEAEKLGEEEVSLFLNVSFVKGEGLLKTEVPNVPG